MLQKIIVLQMQTQNQNRVHFLFPLVSLSLCTLWPHGLKQGGVLAKAQLLFVTEVNKLVQVFGIIAQSAVPRELLTLFRHVGHL